MYNVIEKNRKSYVPTSLMWRKIIITLSVFFFFYCENLRKNDVGRVSYIK